MRSKSRFALSFFGLLFLAVSLTAAKGDSPYYDELFDSEGNLRPQYSEIYKIYSRMSEIQKKRFLKETRLKDFSGDNSLDPLPRVLTESEVESLRQGVEQRGTAIRRFLQDYYSGKDTSSVIPRDVLERIVSRYGESDFLGKIDPGRISFPYGPDIIRTADGRWAVLEDNPGFIGLVGDLLAAREAMLKRQPEFAGKFVADPMDFYRNHVSRAKARAHPRDGKIVMYMVPPYPDNEDLRLKKIYSKLGVEILTPNSKNRLIAEENGVFVKNSSGNLERVGFIFLNTEHAFADGYDPRVYATLVATTGRSLLEEHKSEKVRTKLREAFQADPKTGKVDMARVEGAIRSQGLGYELDAQLGNQVRGLAAAIMDGKVATNYSPGLEFIGDKEFYGYVDGMVRHYLGVEDPILQNLRTLRFEVGANGKITFGEIPLERFFASGEYRKFVFKAPDGRGGSGVSVGHKLTSAEAKALENAIRANPSAYQVQDFRHLSVLENRIVDLRMISDVGPKDIYVGHTPASRGVPRDGNGKVNLSDEGREFMVGVVKDPVRQAALECIRRNMLPR